MSKKKQPLKPDRPLSSIVFSKTSKVRLSVAPLPRTQKELELAVGSKFIGALERFYGGVLKNLVSGDGRGDLICLNEGDQVIKIQVVEAIDHMMRRLKEQREMYLIAMKDQYSDIILLYEGCRLTLVDEGNEPLLPSLKSREGNNALKELSGHLKAFGESLASLEVGKRRVRKWQITPEHVTIVIDCERLAPAGSGVQPFLHWGGSRSFKVSEPNAFLNDAIKQKLQKYYSKPLEEFWLLVYSSDIIVKNDDPEVQVVRRILNEVPHPFDKVWFLRPYDNFNYGHLVLIWNK